jgi:RNA recognition motif-containing protein
MPQDQATKLSKGNAYIDFDTPEAAQAAIS